MNKFIKSLSIFLTVICAFAAVLPCFAENVDNAKECKLTIRYVDKDKVIPNAPFEVYYVANVNAAGNAYAPVGKFASYPVIWQFKDTQMMNDTAFTLSGLAARDGLLPSYAGLTDEHGQISFPGDDGSMLPGLYLINSQRVYRDEDVYVAAPTLVQLPAVDEKTGEFLYDVILKPKFDHNITHSDTETVNCSVLKKWEDENNKKGARPKSVNVILLRDGEIYDRVTLNDENDWRFTWEKLSAKHYWVALEEDSGDYKVLVHRNNTTFIITNTYTPPPPPEETTVPDGEETTVPEETTASGSEETTVPGETTTTPEESTTTPEEEKTTVPGEEGTTVPKEPGRPELPNTGMLWWPVTVFAIAGVVLFIMGWVLLRRYEYDNI